MITDKHLEQIDGLVAQAGSVRGALFQIKSHIDSFANCHLAYEYMIRENAYMRGDLINMTTLPARYNDLYLQSGGTNSDPIIENMAALHEPLQIELSHLCGKPGTKFYKNPFFTSLMDEGCVALACYPVLVETALGHGALTVFANKEFLSSAINPQYYLAAAKQFHICIRSHGHMTRYFDLTAKELFALDKMSVGQTAEDVAQNLGVTRRTIELRLQSARKKLMARTTTEAVFKATAYSILPLSAPQ